MEGSGRRDERRTYEIEVRGRVEVEELNAAGPLQIGLLRWNGFSSVLTARTDQAGLIGLLRHLHGWGIALIGLRRGED